MGHYLERGVAEEALGAVELAMGDAARAIGLLDGRLYMQQEELEAALNYLCRVRGFLFEELGVSQRVPRGTGCETPGAAREIGEG